MHLERLDCIHVVSTCKLNDTMDSSPLGGLPPELRNNIYELALQPDHQIKIWLVSEGLEHKLGSKGHANTFALTRVCRQMRAESSQLFYSLNTFTVVLQTCILWPEVAKLTVNRVDAILEPLQTLIDTIGPGNVASLTSVTLQLGDESSGLSGYTLRRNSEILAAVLREVRDWDSELPKMRLTLHLMLKTHRNGCHIEFWRPIESIESTNQVFKGHHEGWGVGQALARWQKTVFSG
ncbi:hypothetical protein LTR65_002516 [Meristemomyces frigidus]